MPRTTFEPMRVFFIAEEDGILDTAAPTVAEINAGTELTPQIPVDGFNTSPTQNNASQAMLGNAFVAEEPGTWGTGLQIMFVRDDTDDIAEGLIDYRTRGFIVSFPYGGDVEDGNLVDVYAVTAHKPVPQPSAENEYAKTQVTFAVTAEPNYRATIGGES